MREHCAAELSSAVVLARSFGEAACLLRKTWGYDDTGVWVVDGCSAEPVVAAAPTDLGTYPVFEHLAETTMTGTNPDGSKYSDPGIKWVSYFNGGDALHEFPRGSYGFPQSVGCVELPMDAAAKIWPYTPVGTLVNVEA